MSLLETGQLLYADTPLRTRASSRELQA